MRSTLLLAGALALLLSSCSSLPSVEEADAAVLMLRRHESWAWALGIALIWADVALPIPQGSVVAALGIVYGTALGGVLGSIGLVTGGLLGYALMATAARRVVLRLSRKLSLDKLEGAFERRGAWAIILTRSLPYSVPEAIVFLAGIARMPMRQFATALVLGSVPAGFAFAAIGAGWADQPLLALAVSYLLPIPLLPLVLYLLRRRT